MFNVGVGEVFVILLVCLVVFGPERFPEMTRQAGRLIGQLQLLTQSRNVCHSAMRPLDQTGFSSRGRSARTANGGKERLGEDAVPLFPKPNSLRVDPMRRALCRGRVASDVDRDHVTIPGLSPSRGLAPSTRVALRLRRPVLAVGVDRHRGTGSPGPMRPAAGS
jgi:mttA/Hcf106 family protein